CHYSGCLSHRLCQRSSCPLGWKPVLYAVIELKW
ncbi:hypothetical protein I315_06330, partial [Cryptococcus gattii Ru294]